MHGPLLATKRGLSITASKCSFSLRIVSWLLVIAACGASGYAFAEDGKFVPPLWPWHGISIGNLAASPQDVYRLKNIVGLNMLRLQLKPQQWAKTNKLNREEAWGKSLHWLDTMLDSCRAAKVGCIVNISHFPFDQNPAIHEYESTFWKKEHFTREVVKWVENLARHTQNRGGELIAFDIISEAQVWKKGSRAPDNYYERLEQIISAIRKYNSSVWIVISPAPMGTPLAFENFQPLHDPKLIYGAHMYLPLDFTHQGIPQRTAPRKRGVTYPGFSEGMMWNKNELKKSLGYIRDFQLQNNAFILVGEFSAVRWAEGSEQYIQDLASIFNEYGWGWAYFSAMGWHGWNPDYDSAYSENNSAKNHYVGDQSSRWQTVRSIFNTRGTGTQP